MGDVSTAPYVLLTELVARRKVLEADCCHAEWEIFDADNILGAGIVRKHTKLDYN